MSTVDCESFGSIWQLLLHFFMIFREGRGPTLAAKWLQRGYRKVYLHWKSMFWAPKLHLELSDGLHTLYVHMKYPWVLSIARVSDQSYNFYKLFHDFQVSEGSSLAMKRLQKAWFTLKIKGFGSVGLGELARGRRLVISDFPTGLMLIMQTQLFLNKIDNQGRFFSRATKSEIWGDRVPIQQVGPQILGLASVWKWLIRVSTEI